MRNSILIVSFFVVGILLARLDLVPDAIDVNALSLPALWFLMAAIGLAVGSDTRLGEIIATLRPRLLLLPVATTVGTFCGALLGAALLYMSASECLAIGSGFAYYSLSSVFITQYLGAEAGTVALVCNVLREIFTLLFTPLVVKHFGPVPAISCGGATTMDTTLPIIARYAGNQWIPAALIHAMILDFSVPLWVMLFCSWYLA